MGWRPDPSSSLGSRPSAGRRHAARGSAGRSGRPIMTRLNLCAARLECRRGQVLSECGQPARVLKQLLGQLVRSISNREELAEVRVDGEARHERIEVGVRLDLCGVDTELTSPDEASLLTLLDDSVEEAAEHVDPKAISYACQAGMVGEWLSEVVVQIPTDTQSVSSEFHELTLGTKTLKGHDELQLEEANRVDRGPDTRRVTVRNKSTHERQI